MTAIGAPVGQPDEILDVEAGRGERRGLRRLRVAGRPAAAGDRRVDEPDLGPAPAPADERQPWPSGDQRGNDMPVISVTTTSRLPSASTTRSCVSRTYASRRPSGDHCGSPTAFSDAVNWVGGPPRSGMRNSWRAPAASAV